MSPIDDGSVADAEQMLTARQGQVLRLLLTRASIAEIAKAIRKREAIVEREVTGIHRRLRVSGRKAVLQSLIGQ